MDQDIMLHTQEDILSAIRTYINKFKPDVEEKTKIRLEDLCVKKYSLESAGVFYDHERNKRDVVFLACPPNKILLSEALIFYIIKLSYEPHPFSIVSIPNNLYLKYATLHEIYHLALYKINDFFKPGKFRYLYESIENLRERLDEGFACYMALDGSSFLYKDTDEEIIFDFKGRYLSLIRSEETHYEGYRLVKQIVSKHGEGELFKIIKRIKKDNIIQEIQQISGR